MATAVTALSKPSERSGDDVIQKLATAMEPVREAWLKPGAEPRIIRGITLMLLTFGLIAVFSASTVESLNAHGNAWFIFMKQLAFALTGVALMLLVDRLSMSVIRRFIEVGMLVAVALLVLVLIIGTSVNGQKAWMWAS